MPSSICTSCSSYRLGTDIASIALHASKLTLGVRMQPKAAKTTVDRSNGNFSVRYSSLNHIHVGFV
jgi:hypothetical protein